MMQAALAIAGLFESASNSSYDKILFRLILAARVQSDEAAQPARRFCSLAKIEHHCNLPAEGEGVCM